MTYTDGLYYVTVGNPVSKAIIGTTAKLFTRGSSANGVNVSASAVAQQAQKAIMPPLWKLAGRNYYYMRLAGLSGAAAVVLGAIGSHYKFPNDETTELKQVFQTANQFHFFHSIALMAVPLTKRPLMTGTLIVLGTALFSGILYYRALTGDTKYSRFAPMGGTLLISAWLSMLL